MYLLFPLTFPPWASMMATCLVLIFLYALTGHCHQNAVRCAMANPSPSPGEEAARVCLDILRGASQLAQPYAAHLSKLLQEEGREQERARSGPGGLPA
jgi:hypothetical protein